MASERNTKVGDVVQLKSGGPQMTVVSVESDQTVKTTWFCPARRDILTWQFPVDSVEFIK